MQGEMRGGCGVGGNTEVQKSTFNITVVFVSFFFCFTFSVLDEESSHMLVI